MGNITVNTKVFENLKDLALSAQHPWARLSAAVVHRGKLVSVGVNQQKSHPFQKQFGKNYQAIYWHAENFAIFNFIRNHNVVDLEDCDLYVYRAKFGEDKSLITGLAKPCDGCMRCIQNYNIKNVVYTLDGDNTENLHYAIITKNQ